MKTCCSVTLDIIQITPSTTFYPSKLNAAIVYGPGLITVNFLVCMMTEILSIGCFLRHTIQFNVLCVNRLLFATGVQQIKKEDKKTTQ